MRNACPSCQTVYAVTPADVGRRIVCTKCDTALVIDDDGFRRLDPAAKPDPAEPKTPPAGEDEDTVDSDDVKKTRPPASRTPEPVAARRSWAKVDPATVGFAAGLVLVLWFVFMPLVGTAKLKWYTARIEDEQLAHDQEVKRLEGGGQGELAKKKREDWARRKEKLEADVQWVGINNRQGEYWDRYGLLAGFVLTAAGAVGLLGGGQPLVKKVVGAVVVCALLVLVFVGFAWRG